SVAWRRNLQLIPPGDVDCIKRRPLPHVAEEHQNPPIRREGRPLVVESLREHALAGTVGLENADRKITARLTGEGDVVAARRPDRRRMLTFAKADALCRPTICRHHIDLLAAATVAFEADAGAVRRVAGRRVNRWSIGETGGLLRAQVHHE